MALEKSLSRFGFTAGYLALVRIDSLDYQVREAVFIFALWKDKAARRAKREDGRPAIEPLVAKAAVLKLKGPDFDRYFGKGVPGRDDILAQAYAAARAEGVQYWDGALSLADATDDLVD